MGKGLHAAHCMHNTQEYEYSMVRGAYVVRSGIMRDNSYGISLPLFPLSWMDGCTDGRTVGAMGLASSGNLLFARMD